MPETQTSDSHQPAAIEGTSTDQHGLRQLTVIIVTFNSAEYVEGLLKSLPAAAVGMALEVIVVDNASTDSTLDRLAEFNDVTIIAAGGNVGYAAAINIGRRVARAGGPLAILNPDLVLGEEALARLVAELEADRTVGIVTPRLHNADGTTFHHLRREPTPVNALGEALFGSRWSRRPIILSEQLRRGDEYVRSRDVAWAGGAALVVSAACAAAVGDWDEQFFLYAEETDYMARARAAGFTVRYAPSSHVVHEGGGSGEVPALVALMAVNKANQFGSRHPAPAAIAFRLALVLHHLLRARAASHRRAVVALLLPKGRQRLPVGERANPRVVASPKLRPDPR